MVRLAVATRAETFDRISGPLADRGIEVEHVPTTGRAIPITASPAADGDSRSPAVPFDPEAFDAGFVFPPRLMEGGVADALLDVPWLNDRGDVLTSRNKAEVLARCARAGLPVPETVLVSNPSAEDALAEAVSRVGTPAVVKPNSTTRGVGVARVDDYDSLLGLVDYLDLVHEFPATGDKSFLVQEFVPGARDVRAMLIDGEYVGAVERCLPDDARERGRWKHNVHRGAEARGIDLDPDLRSLAEAVAGELDVSLLGVDLLVDGDRAVVSETNARPTIDDREKYEDGFYDRLAAAIERTAARG